ncbi:transcription factor ILI6-like isoform X2 [Zingiber officinale]|uniref:transcription factor ILI6-like isoform X2 n=1 Tax=Zingiber officinale TaxID=94328 RepID=UPI001C4A9E89|nr:transcription factor ILI6-like isoform X2 [Zingiber officinale]
MASRRSRSHQSSSSTRTTDEEQILLSRLASKLQQLLPIAAAGHHSHSRRVSATDVLEETCRYIRSLHREVDDLSERLSELLPGGTGADAAAQDEIIRSLFHGD